MVYLTMFLEFFKVGLFCFGGAFGMIPLIEEIVLAHGWLTQSQFYDFIGVCESTPGPIAVNMATFVGSSQGGVLGAAIATLGVVLPSFIIILIIAMALRGLMKYAGVKAFLGGIRPCVVGLILATAATMLLSRVGGFGDLATLREVGLTALDLRGAAILAILALTALAVRKLTKKPPSPILLILLSAVMGVILYTP